MRAHNAHRILIAHVTSAPPALAAAIELESVRNPGLIQPNSESSRTVPQSDRRWQCQARARDDHYAHTRGAQERVCSISNSYIYNNNYQNAIFSFLNLPLTLYKIHGKESIKR